LFSKRSGPSILLTSCKLPLQANPRLAAWTCQADTHCEKNPQYVRKMRKHIAPNQFCFSLKADRITGRLARMKLRREFKERINVSL
jgi:hypothetical protein